MTAKAKAKTKKRGGSSAAKRKARLSPRVRTSSRPTVRPARAKKRTPRRRAIAKRAAVVAAASRQREPISHFGVRLLSLILLVTAALTNNVAIALAGHDLRTADEVGRQALQITQPREYLYKVAAERELDYRLLERIAHCESSWRMVPNARSSAYGYYQILDATERHTPQFEQGRRKFDPYANIDMAVYLYERYGTSPWSESKPCWGWYEKN